MNDDEINDLLRRIEAYGKHDDDSQPIGLLDAAAEEIKRLRAENKLLRAKLDEAELANSMLF